MSSEGPVRFQRHRSRELLEGGNAVSQRAVLNDAVRRIEKLPPMPTVVHELVSLRTDKGSGVAQLEEIIAQDPVFCAKVIRMANSPFYGARREIRSLEAAVSLLGWDTVIGLATAAAAKGSFSAPKSPAYGGADLWQHSQRVARLSSWLASNVFEYSDDQSGCLFLGALLHDIGQVALEPILNDGAASNQPTLDIVQEKAACTVDHTEVGVELCRRWKLPTEVRVLVDTHHAPQEGQIAAQESAIVHIADIMAAKEGRELAEIRVDQLRVGEAALNILGISAEELASQMEKRSPKFRSLVEQMGEAA